jgi:protein-disulfide isomerase
MPVKKKVSPVKKTEEVVEKKMFPKRDMLVPILVGAIIIASFAVGFLYGKVSVYETLDLKQGTAAAQVPQEAAPVVTLDQVKGLFADGNNLVFGDPNSKVLFVEFSDPSCPYCHIAAGMNPELNKQVGERFTLTADGGTYQAPVLEMKQLVDEGKAAFAWFYSPGHGAGELATQAMYCADEQGAFWEVHDLLMTSEGYELMNETVKNDVNNSGLLADFVNKVADAATLKACLESGKYADRVQVDTGLSREFGVQGTPSFFINEKNFPGAYNFSEMQASVDEALK